ncbi:MAG: Cu(I)-responsive transcriptional regulator [Burkholderiales bacterium]|jgi:Cu(I)-responsive transcriptional regulator|nr:Cu(I)-responsive transcriptional regulator [Burkholderiales bacterium]
MTGKYFELAAARRDGFLNIGEAARASGVSAKMIRHYEQTGVLPAPPRTVAGYRLYRAADVHTLRFVQRARELGFPVREIRELVGLWRNRRRSSAEVQRLASRHLAALERRIGQMEAMRGTLRHLVHACRGDDRPDCPILDDLAGAAPR